MKTSFLSEGKYFAEGDFSIDERKSGGKRSFDVQGLKDVFGFDKPLAIAVLILCLLGILFIYSASKYSAQVELGDAFHYVKTQAIALFVGVLFAFGLSMIDASSLKKFALPLYIVGTILLSLVFLPVLGVESYGAKRWLNLGFFTVQPSEYAKFFMVLLIARDRKSVV